MMVSSSAMSARQRFRQHASGKHRWSCLGSVESASTFPRLTSTSGGIDVEDCDCSKHEWIEWRSWQICEGCELTKTQGMIK